MSKLTRGQGSTSFSHELGDAFQIFCCFSDRSIRLERPMLVLAAARFRVHLVFVVVGAGETKVVGVLELDVVRILRVVLKLDSLLSIPRVVALFQRAG